MTFLELSKVQILTGFILEHTSLTATSSDKLYSVCATLTILFITFLQISNACQYNVLTELFQDYTSITATGSVKSHSVSFLTVSFMDFIQLSEACQHH